VKRRRGRPGKLVTTKGQLKLLAYIEGVARYRHLSIRAACDRIAAGLEFSPDGDNFSGEINGRGWLRGTFIDDPERSAAAHNYSASELRKTYYRLRKLHRADDHEMAPKIRAAVANK
jgi:hypothetical protein